MKISRVRSHEMPLPEPVAEIVKTYPDGVRKRFATIRNMIHEEADRLDAGPMTEALRWGEPAFLTDASRTGTTIRLAWKPKSPGTLALFVHCQTTLIDAWRDRFPELGFDGNRALLLPLEDDLPEDALRICISDALIYHRRKRA